MTIWTMYSKEQFDGQPMVATGFAINSQYDVLAGTITFQGVSYRIFGQWAAAGSLPERDHSAFAIWASNQADAMLYVAATGTIDGPADAPTSILMNLFRASTVDGSVYAWSGTLEPKA